MRAQLVAVTVGTAAAVASLTACGSQPALHGMRPATAVSPAGTGPVRPAASVAGNETATRQEAARLVAVVPVVPGAIRITGGPPAALRGSGPAMGTPMTSSLVDTAVYWHTDDSPDQVIRYATAHPPEGMQLAGSASGSDGEGIAWSEAHRSYATELQAELWVTADPSGGSDIRADGVGEWLDPHPSSDDGKGHRVAVSVAAGCPPSVGRDVGVKPTVTGDALLPPGRPTAGLLCPYGGPSDPAPQLPVTGRLDAGQTARLAAAISRIPVTHTVGGVVNCPAEFGTHVVLAFSYPGRPDADVWWADSGCETLSNGSISVSGGIDLNRVLGGR